MISGVFTVRDTDDLSDLIPLAQTGFYSTVENLRAEQDFLLALKRLTAEKSSLNFPADWLRKKRLNYYESKKDRMDQTELHEQLKVVYDELPCDDCLAILTGPPGAAKTTAATLWVKLAREQNDVPVVLMTQERPALHRMHEKLSFQDAQLLVLSDVLEKDVAVTTSAIVIIDEAGLLGTSTLAALLNKLADSKPQKVILIGDDKQLLPEEAGQPFRWLREKRKVPVSELSFPYRQKDPALRQIVLDLYGGKIADALSKLSIEYVPHTELQKTARELIDALAPDKSLVLVHGNDELRERLKTVCPGYRIYSLAAAQGLAVDQAVLVLAAPINLSEFLVGCSRARHELRIVIDGDAYASTETLSDSIQQYPKKLMVLDVLDEEAVLKLGSR